MRRYLYIILALFIITSLGACNDDNIDEETVSRDVLKSCEQTTIMYFMGTNLRSYFLYYNIADAKIAVADGALGENGRLLIFLPSYTGAELYELYQSNGECKVESVKSYESNESLSYDRIVDVVAESQKFAPANNYNIIFSGHGTGWVLEDQTLRSSSSPVNWNWESGGIMTRYLGIPTNSSEGSMDVAELREALDATSTKYGYLLFDMCFMSNIETLYELRGVCDNIIASPCEVWGEGFPYQTVLAELFSDGGATADLNGACEAYYNDYKDRTSFPTAAVARCVTAGLEDLAGVVKRINEAGVNSVSVSSLQRYEKLSYPVFYDLGDYISNACGDLDLMAEFEAAFEAAFPSEGLFHTNAIYSLVGSDGWVPIDNYWGVSTSAPSTVFKSDWCGTSWAVATEVD